MEDNQDLQTLLIIAIGIVMILIGFDSVKPEQSEEQDDE